MVFWFYAFWFGQTCRESIVKYVCGCVPNGGVETNNMRQALVCPVEHKGLKKGRLVSTAPRCDLMECLVSGIHFPNSGNGFAVGLDSVH